MDCLRVNFGKTFLFVGADTPHLNPLPQTTAASRGLGSPQGERKAMDRWRAYFASTVLFGLMLRNTGPRRPIYVFTKRTHRFADIFWVQTSSRERLVLEMFERIRWVRFGKRTHFRGSNGGGEHLF